MATEKVYQEKTARTIQQKLDGGGTLQFVDNRPMNPVLQQVEEDEEDTLQGKFNQALQREEDEEDMLQGKFEQPVQREVDEDEAALQGWFEAPVQKKNETGMPDHLKVGVEELSGLAYTQGTDIHVAPGQEQHLPHEAWHVAQQMAGRVEPTTEVGGMPVNDNVALEHEADVMGAKANSL